MSATGFPTVEVFQQVFNAHSKVGANKREFNMKGTKWNVAFDLDSEKRMEIEVTLEESDDKINFPIPVCAEFEFAAIGHPNHEVLKYQGLFFKGQSSGCLKMAPLQGTRGFSVRCEVRLHARCRREFRIPPITVAKNKFMDNLPNFFLDKKFSDVSIVVHGQAIKAHKVVLASSSPVFSALLDGNVENKIEVNDIDYETMVQVVTCIYTGKVPDLEDCAEQVLVVADRFQLDWLKNECEDFMMRKIDAENSCDFLIKGYLYNANQFQGGAQAFILANFKDVRNTEGFRKLGETHLHLLLEILQFCDVVPVQDMLQCCDVISVSEVTVEQDVDI